MQKYIFVSTLVHAMNIHRQSYFSDLRQLSLRLFNPLTAIQYSFSLAR